MLTRNNPRIVELRTEEAIQLLERNHIGRIAFSHHGHVDIEPIGYVYNAGWLYGRTSPGTKLSTIQHHPWVALEVDEIKSRFDWKSVVVRGALYLILPEGSAHLRDTYDLALRVLRTVDPDALTPADWVPERNVLFRIHADEVIGRAASDCPE